MLLEKMQPPIEVFFFFHQETFAQRINDYMNLQSQAAINNHINVINVRIKIKKCDFFFLLLK